MEIRNILSFQSTLNLPRYLIILILRNFLAQKKNPTKQKTNPNKKTTKKKDFHLD